jgi:hypothetical protein
MLEVLESRHMLATTPATLGLGIRLLADNGTPTPGAEISSLTVGETFWVEVFVEDQRTNSPPTTPGVISLPLNISWNPSVLELTSAGSPAGPFPEAIPTSGILNRLVTASFPFDRFIQNFDKTKGYSGPDAITDPVTQPHSQGSWHCEH